MDKERPSAKTIYLGFLGLGILALILGFYQLNKSIKSPFQSSAESVQTSLKNQEPTFEEKMLALQNTDTDQDGLSDFDELYTYETSPYLKDSDSDGISDQDEINSGKNPNCPEGQDCGVPASINTNTSANILNLNIANANTQLSENLTPKELRKVLKNAGAPEDVLNNTDDETLMQMYQETLQETGYTGLNLNTGENLNVSVGTTPQITTEYLQNLSAEEIRDLLISSGVDKETLNKVDDATLREIFLQAMKEEGLIQ